MMYKSLTSEFRSYAKKCQETVHYPKACTGDVAELSYLGLGLAGECGEFIDVIKKAVRRGVQHVDELTPEEREKLESESGDVFWYLGQLFRVLEFKLGTVLELNHVKLEGRHKKQPLGTLEPLYACETQGEIRTETITTDKVHVMEKALRIADSERLEVRIIELSPKVLYTHLGSRTEAMEKRDLGDLGDLSSQGGSNSQVGQSDLGTQGAQGGSYGQRHLLDPSEATK